MESFLVRVYKRNNKVGLDEAGEFLGTVKCIESEKRYSFTGPEALWKILTEDKSRRINLNINEIQATTMRKEKKENR